MANLNQRPATTTGLLSLQATEEHSNSGPSNTTSGPPPDLGHSELTAALSSLKEQVQRLGFSADMLRSRLRTRLATTGFYPPQPPHLLQTLMQLKDDAQTHFLHSANLEIRMRLYSGLILSSDTEVRRRDALYNDMQRHKVAVSHLGLRVRNAEWLWGELCGVVGWDREPVEDEIIVNPYQDYLMQPMEGGLDEQGEESGAEAGAV